MSYQKERGECIAQLTRHGLPYPVIETLLRCATSINRYAELACSSEAADRDRIPCPEASWDPKAWKAAGHRFPGHKYAGPCLCDFNGEHQSIPRIRLQDYRAEQRAIKAVPEGWIVLTSGDPRGYTLHVVPPAYAKENEGKDRHNMRSIGVPPGPSRLRF